MIEKLLAFPARIPQDKLLHALAGALLACLFHGLPLGWNVALVGILAVCKEAYDHAHPDHTADLWDVTATVLGALPVWLVL